MVRTAIIIRAAIIAVACALLATACTESKRSSDELQVVEDPVAATPAKSPPVEGDPEGRVVGIGGEATAVTIEPETRTLVVGVADGGDAEVAYLPMDEPGAKPDRVDVPGPVESLTPADDGTVSAAVPGEDRILRLTPRTEKVDEKKVGGEPAAVAHFKGKRLVALRDRAAVRVLEDGVSIAGEIASADQVVVAGEKVAVLDRLRSAVFEVKVGEGEIGLGLRAGQGATNAVADRYGRVLTVDTRTGALLAFSVDPLVLRQRYPVAGVPYGLAYDAERDLAWVTLTERNEVVGYHVGGAEPDEKYRFPTVRQPNSVTVDEQTGSVVVASAVGEGIQVIQP